MSNVSLPRTASAFPFGSPAAETGVIRAAPRTRILVCGGRDFTDRLTIYTILDYFHKNAPIAVLIHGAAQGADMLADDWAKEKGIMREPYPANWSSYHGANAGRVRNVKMLREGKPDLVIAFPGGKGTKHMRSIAKEKGLPVFDIAMKVKGREKPQEVPPPVATVHDLRGKEIPADALLTEESLVSALADVIDSPDSQEDPMLGALS